MIPTASLPIRILFLAANPRGTEAARLMQEARLIQERLREAGLHQRFQFIPELAVRPTDLSRLLMTHDPHIVHFASHGASTGEILLEDAQGDLHPVAPKVLAGLFRILRDNIQGVVINTCWSEAQAEALSAVVPWVVGMAKAIPDEAALAFAGGFYRGLGFERTLQVAFELGCHEIAYEHEAEQTTPQLRCAAGLDPATYRLGMKPVSTPAIESPERQGLPPTLTQRLHKVLLASRLFDNDQSLRPLFVDQRLYTWRSQLPTANNAVGRVQAVIDILYDQTNDAGRGALGLLVEVIADQTPQGTSLKRDLVTLAAELRALGY